MKKFILYLGMIGFLLTNFVLADELWDQFKQRVTLNKELKSKFAKKAEQPLPPMPANFLPQTMMHLRTLFGPGKTEDEYIALGVKYSSTEQYYFDEGYQNIKIDTKAIAEKYGEYIQYAKKMIANEKKYWPYYVFYHSQKSGLSIIQDFLSELYGWLNLETPHEQTKLLRMFVENEKGYKNIDAFLAAHKNDIMNSFPIHGTNFFDHLQDVILNLLSANLALFANAGYTNESSWYYWYANKSIHPPNLNSVFSRFFKAFGFNEKFIPALLELNELKSGTTMCQIFIHPDVVDQITYLCWAGGSPLVSIIPPSMQELDAMGSSLSTKIVPDVTPDLLKMQKQLEQVIYDPQLKRISVKKYLSVYSTQPERIPWGPVSWRKGDNIYFINDFQARIYWEYSLLLDPEKVKIITYTSYKGLQGPQRETAEKLYQQKLSVIVEELIKDWLLTENKNAEGKTKIEKFFEMLKSR